MYKVFFNERAVFFVEDFFHALKNESGLFYKYVIGQDLKNIAILYFELTDINRMYIVNSDCYEAFMNFTSAFKRIEAAGGLVRNTKGEFLVIFRNGMWDLPKGKKEKGENPEQTALREVSEECGLMQLKIVKPLIITYHCYMLQDSPILKVTNWFEMISDDQESPVPQKIENITHAQWADPQNLDYLLANTYPSIIEVLEAGRLI